MSKDDLNQSGVGLPAGTKIGKYEVREKLGAGGTSVVYKCHDGLLDRSVAAKQISAHLAEDRKFLEHFRREAQILAKLGAEQPAIVTIYDLVEDEHGLFIVMEYVEGSTVEQILQSQPTAMAPKPAVQLLWRLAGGMAAVHGAGIIHRDLKPGNVIVSEGYRPKITDFGVAASLSGQTSMLMGTTKYMAPELFGRGDVDARSDMYSLGFIFYELLLGRGVFNEIFDDVVRDPRIAAVRWMKWHGNESVQAPPLHQVNPAIPKELSDIIARMTAKNRDQRYPDMEALGQAIKTDLAGVPLADEAQVAERTLPQAAILEPPPIEEIEVAPEPLPDETPTAALPKSTLSTRTKIILASVIGATFLILVVGLAWRGYVRNQRLDQSAAAVFKRGVDAYDKEDYAQAATVFADVAGRFGGTEEAVKAAILKPIAESRLAVEQSQWDRASELEGQADRAVHDLQRTNKSPRIVKWTRRITKEIEDIRDYRLGVRQFEEALIRAAESMADERYDDALFVLKNDVPEIGFAPKRAERLASLRDEILRCRFEAEYATLIDRAEQMLEHDAESDALAMYQAMDTMLRSRDARVISPERRQELRDALQARRQGLLALRERRDLEDKVRVAREAGDKLAERVALEALQERWPSEGAAQRIKKLTADIMFEEAETFRKEGRLGRAVENYQEILKLLPDYEDARERLNELKEETQRELIRSQADKAYATGKWDDALSLYLKLEEGRDSAVTNRIKTCRFMRKLVEVDKARDKALAEDDAEALRGLLSDYAAIGEIDPSRIAADITPRLQDIERVLRRWELIAEGKDYAAKKKWTQAIRALKKARDTSGSDEEIAEVESLITQTEYDKYMALGNEALDRRDLVAARAYFLRARDRKITDEVEKQLAHVQRMIDEDQD